MSKLFNETLNKIKENKLNFDTGKPNCIPFEWFPKLRRVLPGIIQGTNWIISASSGVKNKVKLVIAYINNIYYIAIKNYENTKLFIQ
jgi:hypothetical protein